MATTVVGGLYITDTGTNWRDANGKLLGEVKYDKKGKPLPFKASKTFEEALEESLPEPESAGVQPESEK